MSKTPPEQGTILIVDDTPANLRVLLDTLSQQGFQVLVARSGERALEQVQHARPDLILLDVVMPGLDGFETCRRLKADPNGQEIPVIFMTALSDTTDKVRGFEAGAVDYVTKPFQQEEVLARVTTHLTLRRLQTALQEANRHLERRVATRTADLQSALGEVEQLKNRLQAENVYLQEEIRQQHHDFTDIVGQSPALLHVLGQVETLAPTDSTVLILGETGTGKELIARAIHDRSRRRQRPLVKVNCAAISAGLVESELFGHVKGAFTGAIARRRGRFELADGGTLFLDEVGDLPQDTQVKLLRVLQEREFEPVGSTETRRVDVRIIAATHRDLEQAISEGSFRSDLYYRLNVLPLTMPPLRDRRSDIPLLVQLFVERFTKGLGKNIEEVATEAMDQLLQYDWPGNVRELQNIVERAVVLSRGPILTLDLPLGKSPSRPRDSQDGAPPGSANPAPDRETQADLPTLAEAERRHIRAALLRCAGVVGGPRGAAKVLDLHPNTLRSRMKKLRIEPPA